MADPLRIANRYLIRATAVGSNNAHREDGLIAIGSSNDNIFAVEVVFNCRIYFDTHIIQQVPQ